LAPWVRVSWEIWVSFRGLFWRLIYFCYGEIYLSFHNSSFALRYIIMYVARPYIVWCAPCLWFDYHMWLGIERWWWWWWWYEKKCNLWKILGFRIVKLERNHTIKYTKTFLLTYDVLLLELQHITHCYIISIMEWTFQTKT